MTDISEILDNASDSFDYNILVEACEKASLIDGLTCEIGLYKGGSTYKIMNKMKELGKIRPHIGIDPYGNIEYVHWEKLRDKNISYTNQTRNITLSNLYIWCSQNNYPFIFFNMEDTEFFSRFPTGVPIYDESKYIINSYSLVFYDGPHSVESVRTEIDFFKDRTPIGGCWVFDDINQYPHMEFLDKYVKSLGFVILNNWSNYKISYIRREVNVIE